jgi:hypothetical protein
MIKHRLTTDEKVSGYIEATDWNYEFSRTDLKEAWEPFLAKIRNMITQLSEVAIDRVQMIGGMSRIPIIQETVKEAFGVSQLYFNLNAEEANAFGAGYIGASLSTDYNIKEYKYWSLDIYPIRIVSATNRWNYSKIPPVYGERLWIETNVTRRLPTGSSPNISWGVANRGTIIEKTKDGLYRFRNSTSKPVREWKTHMITVAKKIRVEKERQARLGEKVNHLESLVLEVRQSLGRMHATEKELEALQIAVNVTDTWYLKQQSFEEDSLMRRLQLLEDAVGGAMCRLQNEDLLPIAEDNMTELFRDVEDAVKGWMTAKKRPSRKDIRGLLRMCVDVQLWYEEKKYAQGLLGEYDLPVLRWDELKDRVDAARARLADLEGEASGKARPIKDVQNFYMWPPGSAHVQVIDAPK